MQRMWPHNGVILESNTQPTLIFQPSTTDKYSTDQRQSHDIIVNGERWGWLLWGWESVEIMQEWVVNNVTLTQTPDISDSDFELMIVERIRSML